MDWWWSVIYPLSRIMFLGKSNVASRRLKNLDATHAKRIRRSHEIRRQVLDLGAAEQLLVDLRQRLQADEPLCASMRPGVETLTLPCVQLIRTAVKVRRAYKVAVVSARQRVRERLCRSWPRFSALPRVSVARASAGAIRKYTEAAQEIVAAELPSKLSQLSATPSRRNTS